MTRPDPDFVARGVAPRPATITRRSLIAGLAACGCGAFWSSRLRGEEHADDLPALSAAEALERLKAGNQRFVEDRVEHDHSSRAWRKGLVAGQHPFAVILGCSDSRVPPELIFDQGFGDLFVVRNAGNVIATDVIASIEYAAVHLKTSLVVVMGHEGCGAVSAAVQSREVRKREPIELQATLQMIEVAVSDANLTTPKERSLTAAIERNVRWGVKRLKYLAAERGPSAMGSARVVGAFYELQSGRVRFL
jgi:carbonic anhydrase